MKLISKIEVEHFRSFLGTPQQYEMVIDNLADLNIFSGSNDSGKSNILRALNLFFNNEISHGIPFEFDRDFFIGKSDAGHKVIEISISFDLSSDPKRDKFLPEKFKISKYYDRNGFRNYTYTFDLKDHGHIRVDSRAENNKKLAETFTPENATVKQKSDATKREWVYRVKFSGFLNKSVSFEYVPAIRDKNFFAKLFGRLITKIKNNEDKRIEELKREKNKIENWKKTIQNKTEKSDFKENIVNSDWRTNRLREIKDSTITESKLKNTIEHLEGEINKYSKSFISSITFLESEFKIGKNLQEFFEGFDVGTGQNKSISLSLRGDGIQAKYVPKILDFLSQIDTEKKYYIWGFEEPENSSEYKNQQELAKEFKEIFSKDKHKQIFITTHSEEFLQLYDGSDIKKEKRNSNLYHVKKLQDNNYGEYSKILLFDADRNEFEFANPRRYLDDDLGQSYLRAKYSKELIEREKIFLEETEKIQQENRELQNSIAKSKKPLVFVEDTYDQLYKIAWLKVNNQDCTKDNFQSIFDQKCPYLIFRMEGAKNLTSFLKMTNVDYLKDKKIICLFDFDQMGVEQYQKIKNKTYWNVTNIGDKLSGIHKKRSDHVCFYAMLLPIPHKLESMADLAYPSFVEVENLLPDDFLLKNRFATKKTTTGNTQYLKINDGKKSEIWEKALESLPKDYENFKPLFEKINNIFGL